MQVTAITHKRKPVFASIISQVTPSESSLVKKVAYEPLYLSHLKDALVDPRRAPRRYARAADQSAPGDLRAVRARHAAQRRCGAASTARRRLQAIFGKVLIAVSEDIDPDNLDAVLWSIAYRCNPIEDVQIAPYHAGGQGSQYSEQDRLAPADRRHRQGPDGAARAAETGIHGARAGAVGEARPAADRAQAAVARLLARRLDRALGYLGGSARSAATGRRPARKRWRASAAASSRKRLCAR